jgi:acyl-CoA thioesterase-1
MNWVIYFFGSGTAFFAGIGLVLISIAVFSRTSRIRPKVVATLIAVLGLILVTLSSTPLPYYLYALAGGVTLPWIVAERNASLSGWRRWLRWGVGSVWIAMAAVEIPHLVTPTVAMTGRPRLYVLGDSITAGLNEGEDTWPRILARTKSIEVGDYSHVGADVTSALRQADKLPSDGGLVLIEIGGNDLLGYTSAAEFERGLDKLLQRVNAPNRALVMFELPLPPFCNEFGLSQRRLAGKHGVTLIPKRVLMAVLTPDAATVDSIHLTHAGQERLAETVWSIVGPNYVGKELPGR